MGRRILVVEDEPLIAEMLREWILELGGKVAGPAATNEAALAILENESVDGAILDISVLDGHTYEVARILQQRGVPFVFATGHETQSIDRQFQSAPALQKPFEFQALADIILGFQGAES